MAPLITIALALTLNQVQSRLPAQAKASLGPDASGVGWIYQYALVNRSGKMDISQLRALQDWFLKYELKTVPDVPDVAEVASVARRYDLAAFMSAEQALESVSG